MLATPIATDEFSNINMLWWGMNSLASAYYDWSCCSYRRSLVRFSMFYRAAASES